MKTYIDLITNNYSLYIFQNYIHDVLENVKLLTKALYILMKTLSVQ